MAKIRNVKDILTKEDYEYLGEVVDILDKHKKTLRNNTSYSEAKIQEIADVMLEYTTCQTILGRLDSELEGINGLRMDAKRKYESSKNKKDQDKYLKQYLDLTNKMKAIKGEQEHYNYSLNNVKDKALEYDRIVNNALDREEERKANKNKTTDPNRATGPKKK